MVWNVDCLTNPAQTLDTHHFQASLKLTAIRIGIGLIPAKLRPVNLLRCLLATVFALAYSACSSMHHSKSRAQIYEGDSSPGIRMFDETPGSPVGQ